MQNEYAMNVLVERYEACEAYPIIVKASLDVGFGRILAAMRRAYVRGDFDGSTKQLKQIIRGGIKIRGISRASKKKLKVAMKESVL